MNTKIVYVVVSSFDDIFLEQAWVSMWSLKHYNPNAEVVMIADEETLRTTEDSRRKGILELVDKRISVHFEAAISNKERSRALKIQSRQLVEGDFLYIDSDTVIADEFPEVDNFDFDIGTVYDLHMPTPYDAKEKRKWVKALTGYDFGTDEYNYFNGGLCYVKDNPVAHEFFDRWMQNWKIYKDRGLFLDQPALNITNHQMGGVITPMSGIYNCMIPFSIKYLHTAKIIHFFTSDLSGMRMSLISPFQRKDIFLNVRNIGEISSDIQQTIINCKSEFDTPSMPIDNERFNMMITRPHRLLQSAYIKTPRFYGILDNSIRRIAGFKKRLWKG